MAVEKIVTLCKEGDSTQEYYPNIKGDNIPDKAVAKAKLTQELQDEIDGKAPQSTTYNKTEIDNKLSGKVNVATYNAKVSELENAIGNKANASDVYDKTQVYTKSETYTLLTNGYYNQTEIDLKFENFSDNISDNYYAKDEVDYELNLKADKSTTYTKTETDVLLNGKQAKLESGTNIKTLNNQSLLGSGNLNVGLLYDPSNIVTDFDNLINNKFYLILSFADDGSLYTMCIGLYNNGYILTPANYYYDTNNNVILGTYIENISSEPNTAQIWCESDSEDHNINITTDISNPVASSIAIIEL